ncbi:MAG TPA: biopolymer transporter ExbD [Phycisphaerales bacterium]|nr:biopolymer transporter ExbD [Phycisphaerales bacterium]HMP37914.1 biopolymer transporter ExbD [Phycisphaerales bacterium]
MRQTLRLRRTVPDARIEMMPMIDVIFLLLTFFVYAMILMVRAELLPMNLRQFSSARPATPAPAAVISIDLEGGLHLDREAIALDQLRQRLTARRMGEPDLVLYLAVADGEASVDRAPLLQDIWDTLKDAGLEISLVGRPKDSGAPRAPAAPPP